MALVAVLKLALDTGLVWALVVFASSPEAVVWLLVAGASDGLLMFFADAPRSAPRACCRGLGLIILLSPGCIFSAEWSSFLLFNSAISLAPVSATGETGDTVSLSRTCTSSDLGDGSASCGERRLFLGLLGRRGASLDVAGAGASTEGEVATATGRGAAEVLAMYSGEVAAGGERRLESWRALNAEALDRQPDSCT